MLLFASVSFAQIQVMSYPMTFTASTVTDTVNLLDYRLDGYSIAGVQFDSSNLATSYTLKVSPDNVNFGDLKDVDDANLGVIATTANNKNTYAIKPNNVLPLNYVYLSSDSTETCVVKLILWKQGR